MGSNHSRLCVTLGKPVHLSASQVRRNILIADINVYLIRLFSQLTTNPHKAVSQAQGWD